MTPERDMLRAVVDTLLPGLPGAWPSATAAGVDEVVRADAVGHEPLRVALDIVLARIGADFAVLGEAARVSILAGLEADEPAAIGTLVSACYLAYYTAPAVLRVLAAAGYDAGPPQPGGHHLTPFDETALDAQRRRTPFWRKADM